MIDENKKSEFPLLTMLIMLMVLVWIILIKEIEVYIF